MGLPLKASPPAAYLIETKSVTFRRGPAGGELLDYLPWWWSRHSSSTPVLHDVSFSCLPGQITTIVGPSGAGKSTILSLLAGALPSSEIDGQIFLNGLKMDGSLFRRLSGFVPQEDSLFPLLTVRESLVYSARLRVNGVAVVRADEMIRLLGLCHVAESLVGSGISGGERRRVSIGVELVHRPGALLLDEPLSGLDSSAAVQIMRLLKEMAMAEGKTVVLTVHQPGIRILEMVDKVVLLAGGEVRHRGSLAQLERRLSVAGHVIPAHINALEYAMEEREVLFSLPGEEEEKELKFSPSTDVTSPAANSAATEVLVLTARLLVTARRTNLGFPTKMVQSLAAGLVLGSVFMRANDLQARVGFFAFCLTFLLSSTAATMAGLIREREIVMRENSRGAYRLSSYAVASAVVFLPALLTAAVMFATPAYWLAGLRREVDGFLFFVVVAWLALAAADSLVCCVAAAAPTAAVGTTASAGLIGCFFLFSGYFISKRSMPGQWVFLHYLSLFKYPFEALLVNEYGGERRGRVCLQREDGVCIMDGEMFLRREGLEEARRWVRVGVMVGFVAGYRVLALGILWLRSRRFRV